MTQLLASVSANELTSEETTVAGVVTNAPRMLLVSVHPKLDANVLHSISRNQELYLISNAASFFFAATGKLIKSEVAI